MTFRFQSRYALLTYSQCGDLDPFRVMDLISSLAGECIIGRERHEDGGLHLHVFCDFGRKFRSGRADVFDVDGIHPNIQRTRVAPEAGYDYATKDGDIVCGGLERPEGRAGVGESANVWSQIAEAATRDEFWELCHKLAPKATLTSFPSLRAYCDWRFRPILAEYESPRGAKFTSGESDGRDAWLRQSGIGGERNGRVMSLVLYGRSQTGKTTWARSLGKHMYSVGLVSGVELLKAPDVDYAVFDDMRGGIKFFHSWKEWLGCQPHVSVKVLYKEPQVVAWGKPGIWCSNTDPRNEMTDSEIEWMNINCTFIECNEKIVEFS